MESIDPESLSTKGTSTLKQSQWRVTALINFPKQIVGTVPSSPGSLLPESITFLSRIPAAKRIEIGEISVVLRPWPGPSLPTEWILDVNWQENELAALALLVTSSSAKGAIAKIEAPLEDILDSLSLQLQVAIRVFQLEVLDVTPPLETNVERRVLLYPFPQGYPSPKFSQSLHLGSVHTAFYPDLTRSIEKSSLKTRAALRWYIKGLASPYEVDKFIYFWIALETLWTESEVQVQEPYRCAKCKRETPKCENCKHPTTLVVRGASIQDFLKNQLGIDAVAAKKLWMFRQIVHGNNKLESKDIVELPRLVQTLMSAAVTALKSSLNWDAGRMPSVTEGGPSVAVSTALEGTRAIEDFDLLF